MSKTTTISLRAKEGKEEELKNTLTQLITPCRSTEGCLDYHITQSSEDPRSFMAFMIWKDEEAFKRHEDSALIQDLQKEKLPPLVEQGPDLKDWRDLG
jgi:quinol monooxygenase YgiN